MRTDEQECPRCAALRGRSVKMLTVSKGPPERTIKTAYECPSCDYVIVLQPFSSIRAIRTEADYKATLARIDALMDARFGTPEGEELDVLTDLIELYEARHVPMG